MLDLLSVRLFVLAVDLGSLTRAAEAGATVQPAVSQRIKALEKTLGLRLLERTPRFVRPTEAGVVFLGKARALLRAHDEAARFAETPHVRVTIGASDHALGTGLERVVRQVRAALPPDVVIDLRLGLSQTIRRAYDEGELSVAVIRREGGSEGETLGFDPLGWRAAEAVSPSADGVPLALLGPPCGVRAVAIRRLEEVGRPWREAFTAGSCAALLAGVRAGLGAAPMGAAASGGLADAGPALGLPSLPASEVVMFARTPSTATAAAARAVEHAMRALLSAR